jgi:hypothetical protein
VVCGHAWRPSALTLRPRRGQGQEEELLLEEELVLKEELVLEQGVASRR